MTSYDLAAFTETFDGLARVLLTRRVEDGERSQMLRDYFKALRPYPVEAVKRGAEAVLATAKHFPKPAEWVEAMPRTATPQDAPIMREREAAVWRDAEARGWEGDPCACADCQAAHVGWKPLRFVPEVDEDGRDRKVLDQARNRVVTAGHWAHGQELAGYYRAMGAFYALGESLRKAGKIPAVLITQAGER